MAEQNWTALYERLTATPNFVVQILWIGPEDKPFYKAVLFSESQTGIERDNPFYGYAAISQEEFANLLSVLKKNGLMLTQGEYTEGGSQYIIKIDVSPESWRVELGFSSQTLEILGQIETALDTANRQPIVDIIARIANYF